MPKSRINIAFIDTSVIIFKGISGIMQQTGKNYRICYYPGFEIFLQSLWNGSPQLVIINPLIIQNNIKLFLNVRSKNPQIKWAGILYTFCSSEVLAVLDGNIQITDSPDFIENIIETLTNDNESTPFSEKEYLTARETDILKLILQSLTNKEIANRLNLSVHTVISHRRKIFLKTHTNKLIDLLNWAIANKIVNMERIG